MFTIAAGADDPNHALRFFQWSLWAFLVGVTAAGAAVLFRSLRIAESARHIAAITNRDNLQEAVRQVPEHIASPKALADRMNTDRNRLIDQSNDEHRRAERSWAKFKACDGLWKAALAMSALAFITGFAAPLAQMTWLGKSIAPVAVDAPPKPKAGGDAGG